MNKLLLILSISVLAALSGCATPTTPLGVRVEVQEVKVPVYQPCSVQVPETPIFSFDSAKVEMNVYDKVKLLLIDRRERQAYETELLAALKACVKQ